MRELQAAAPVLSGLSFFIGWLSAASSSALLLATAVALVRKRRRHAVMAGAEIFARVVPVSGSLLAILLFAELALSLSGNPFERITAWHIFTRPRATLFEIHLFVLAVLPQLFWFRSIRRSAVWGLLVALAMTVDANYERAVMLILSNTAGAHARTYDPLPGAASHFAEPAR